MDLLSFLTVTAHVILIFYPLFNTVFSCGPIARTLFQDITHRQEMHVFTTRCVSWVGVGV